MKRSTLIASFAAAACLTGRVLAGGVQVPGELGLTIQEGIDVAITIGSDEVIVATGTYVETIDFRGAAIRLTGSVADPSLTIIDGDGMPNVVQCVNGEGPDTVIEGFTVTNGDRGMLILYESHPTIRDCVFTANAALGNGGGIGMNVGSSPTITDCVFSGNTTLGRGGGIYCTGGCHPVVTNCLFENNSADVTGGGMHNSVGSNPVVTGCTFVGNSAFEDGGGVDNDGASPSFLNCVFDSNWTVVDDGGGMQNNNGSAATVTNCLFVNNTSASQGGAILNFTNSPSTYLHCTIMGNTAAAGAAFDTYNSTASISNSIIWGNNASIAGPGVTTATYCNVEGGFAGAGNIDSNPLFVDEPGGDLRLADGSPSIDAADSVVTVGAGLGVDLDGSNRGVDGGLANGGVAVFGITVDMGAYEFQRDPCIDDTCPADVDGDGVVDGTDLLFLLGAWGSCAR